MDSKKDCLLNWFRIVFSIFVYIFLMFVIPFLLFFEDWKNKYENHDIENYIKNFGWIYILWFGVGFLAAFCIVIFSCIIYYRYK